MVPPRIPRRYSNKYVRHLPAVNCYYLAIKVNLEPELLSRYQDSLGNQPLDRRQLYQLLDSNSASEPTLPQWHGFTVLAVDGHPPNLLVPRSVIG